MTHLIQFSGGLSSWAAAKRVAVRCGTVNLKLLFTDTLAEDADLYRFLIQGAADVFGLRSGNIYSDAIEALAQHAMDVPPEREDTLADRKAFLATLRRDVTFLIPGLVWIAEGRTPWEVFFDERFLGNSRIDPCSKILKRQLADRWRREHCHPAATTVYLGFNYDEQHRMSGLLNRLDGWRVEFPMAERPHLDRIGLMGLCMDAGLTVPRLYFKGFKHNNCGGRCVKAGHAAWARTLGQLPELYAYDERQEQRFRDAIAPNATILTDRSGGTGKRSLTLKQFRSRASAGLFDPTDFGACSCFEVDPSPAAQVIDAEPVAVRGRVVGTAAEGVRPC